MTGVIPYKIKIEVSFIDIVKEGNGQRVLSKSFCTRRHILFDGFKEIFIDTREVNKNYILIFIRGWLILVNKRRLYKYLIFLVIVCIVKCPLI